MESLEQFLAMGGYAPFIWPAFALSAIVLIGVLATSLHALRSSERALANLADGKDNAE